MRGAVLPALAAAVAVLACSAVAVEGKVNKIIDLNGDWIVAESDCRLYGNVTIQGKRSKIYQIGNDLVWGFEDGSVPSLYAQDYMAFDRTTHVQVPEIHDYHHYGRGNCWGGTNLNGTVVDGTCRFEGVRSCTFQLACEGHSCSGASREAPRKGNGSLPIMAFGYWQVDEDSACHQDVEDFGFAYWMYQSESVVLINSVNWRQGAWLGDLTADGAMTVSPVGGGDPVCNVQFDGLKLTGTCRLKNKRGVTAPCDFSAKVTRR